MFGRRDVTLKQPAIRVETWRVGWLFNTAGALRKRRGKREEERFSTDLLTSTLGDVVDLSGNGIRIRRRNGGGVTVGQVVKLTLKSDQCQVTIKCRVVRLKRIGMRQCDIGLTFAEIRPGLKNALHSLARFGFIPNLGRGTEESSSRSKAHRSALPGRCRFGCSNRRSRPTRR